MEYLNPYKEARKIILSPESYYIIYPEKEAIALVQLLESTKDPATSLVVLGKLLQPIIYRIFPLNKLLNECVIELNGICRSIPFSAHIPHVDTPCYKVKITGSKADAKKLKNIQTYFYSLDSFDFVPNNEGVSYFDFIKRSSTDNRKRIELIKREIEAKNSIFPVSRLTAKAKESILKLCKKD